MCVLMNANECYIVLNYSLQGIFQNFTTFYNINFHLIYIFSCKLTNKMNEKIFYYFIFILLPINEAVMVINVFQKYLKFI